MKVNFNKLSIVSEFEVYETENDLPGEEKNLLNHAKTAANCAYAPYSNFLVGAAVLLENNEIVIGNNQENAAYPSGLCAERVAVFYAGTKHPGIPIKAIAIACKTSRQPTDSPCGACRQVIAEYESRYNRSIRIIMGGQNGKVFVAGNIGSLLPFMFNSKHLE
jgi:cytidine deaminase